MENLTPAPSKNPEPILSDYVADATSCKISSKYDYPLSPPPQYAKMRLKWLDQIFWFFFQPTAKTPAPAPIFTINTSNNVVSRKYVPFGGSENKILHFNHISPPQKKTQIFGQFSMGLKRVKKALKWGCSGVNYP